MKISGSLINAAIALFAALVIAVFVTSGVSRAYLAEYAALVEEMTNNHMKYVVRMAAQLVTEQELEEYKTPEDANKPSYAALKQKLIDFSQNSFVKFTYYIRKAPDGTHTFIVDNDLDPETKVYPGQRAGDDNEVDRAYQGEIVSMGIGTYSVGWDGLMTVYAPMFAEDRTVFAVAGVDLEDVTIVRIMKQNRDIQIVFIAELIAVIVVGAFLIWVLQRRAEEFNKISRVKTDFLSRMSHEIRTPMNAIIGLLRMASESKDVPTIHSYIANISISSNFLLSLINDILDISKIEAGKMSLERTTVRLPVLIETIRAMLTSQAVDKKIHVEFSLEDGLPDTIIADSVRLTQIIMNLVGNALKFTPEGGRIKLEVFSLGAGTHHHLEFRVTDNGIGIAPEYIDKLFDPFEQGAGSTTRKFGGTGLGLAISRRLVEMMGGHIHVKSVEGAGSTFIFDIYAEAPASEIEASIEPENTGNVIDLTGKRILIVEDNDINQMIAESTFTRMGAEVVLAGNGQEGIDAFLAEPEGFDIIFMDLQMPVMDGIEATKRIRKSGAPTAKTIPIIAMTANVFAEDIERTRTAGMNAHLGKPFEINNVIAAIRKVL